MSYVTKHLNYKEDENCHWGWMEGKIGILKFIPNTINLIHYTHTKHEVNKTVDICYNNWCWLPYTIDDLMIQLLTWEKCSSANMLTSTRLHKKISFISGWILFRNVFIEKRLKCSFLLLPYTDVFSGVIIRYTGILPIFWSSFFTVNIPNVILPIKIPI